MDGRPSRMLLFAAATILAVGGALHALSFFTKAQTIIDRAQVSPFFAAELKVLWLADSATLLSVAIVFAFVASISRNVSGAFILAVGPVPGATTILLYIYLGTFFAAHMLAAATVLIIAASLFRISGQRAVQDSGQASAVVNS